MGLFWASMKKNESNIGGGGGGRETLTFEGWTRPLGFGVLGLYRY